MLRREQDLSSSIVYTPLHRCHDLFDNSFYVHIIYGIPLHRNDTNQWNCEQFILSGGILCDEMGLGKSMCVLLTSLLNKCSKRFLSDNIDHQLFLNENEEFPMNKKFKSDHQLSLPCICGRIAKVQKKDEDLFENFISICTQCSRLIHKKCYIQHNQQIFICPYCEQRLTDNQQLLPTGATLIIAPAAIIDQWIEEINKHLDCSLNIYMYEGIVNKIPIPDRYFLAKQDFIFCSYENLKKDIHHNEVCSKEHHSTRTQVRKYEYLISPLLRLKFWRLG
jgi:E3 ubiquitin-protein ligase SHPRH